MKQPTQCAICRQMVTARKSYADGNGGRICKHHEGSALVVQGVAHRRRVAESAKSTRRFMGAEQTQGYHERNLEREIQPRTERKK